jgi:peptidoglycan/LPS O-acetylase OafA/YrhL
MKSNYANLDLLRTLAVLSVVCSHIWKQCVAFHLIPYDRNIELLQHNLSFTGVMFFFVHTCLVLMLSMHRSPTAHLAQSFFIRRAFRIYPLCWATILLSLGTGLTDEAAGGFHSLGWFGVSVNVLLVHNIVRRYSSVIGPLWSLDWEVQMYLVLPLFFFVLRRFDRLRVVFGIWLGSALLAVAATQPALPRAFHGAIFPPMFIAGMVSYKLLVRRDANERSRSLPAWGWPLLIAGLFALQSLLMGARSFESSEGAALDAGICITLALAIPAFKQLSTHWIVLPAQQIAKYSYSIYLLHIPALIFVLRYLPGLPLAWKIVLFFFLTALLSYLSFHVVEDPLIRMGKRLAERVQIPSVSCSSNQISSGAVLHPILVPNSGSQLPGER